MGRQGQFKAGNSGKPKGTQNKLTRTVKETVLLAFNKLQADPNHNLDSFAKKYPRDFYAIAAKLIPTEVQATVEATINWVENKTYEAKPETDSGT